MTCKKYSNVALRVIFKVYMFGILSKTLPSIFHQGLRSSEFESHRSLKSRHCWRRRCSHIRCYLEAAVVAIDSWPPSILSPPSLAIVDSLPPSMVSYRHSPPQPLSHEISLMQMSALDSYHVSNLKFRHLKSNYVLS